MDPENKGGPKKEWMNLGQRSRLRRIGKRASHTYLLHVVTYGNRDIYYRDPALFGKQSHVDRYIDNIALTLDVPRSALNVVAVSKGLFAGALSVCRRDGSTLDATTDRDGSSIPSVKDVFAIHMQKVSWILVVEKEATFRSIATSNLWSWIAEAGLIVTGKGYPDVATRAFLRILSHPTPSNGFCSPPVYSMVDLDPDGLAIHSVYKYGSLALSHENAALRVPQLEWLGLRDKHLKLCSSDLHASQGLLALTAQDRKKAVNMIERGQLGDSNCLVGMECVRVMQNILMLNLKAEMQILEASPGLMTKILSTALPLQAR